MVKNAFCLTEKNYVEHLKPVKFCKNSAIFDFSKKLLTKRRTQAEFGSHFSAIFFDKHWFKEKRLKWHFTVL